MVCRSIESHKKKIFLVTILCVVFLVYTYLSTTPNKLVFHEIEGVTPTFVTQRLADNTLEATDTGTSSIYSYRILPFVEDQSPFNINGTDVLVHLHIQKTGGTELGHHLIWDLKEITCTKRALKTHDCYRPHKHTEWLFSRYSSGWTCGLHADWTSLTECVPKYFDGDLKEKRRYFYVTVLREPVARYLSEWRHVSRGATWKKSYLRCNGKRYKYPRCYKGEDWKGVSLEDFMDCDDNKATNRQTTALANLRAVNCSTSRFSDEQTNKILLQTAKQNLQDMVFFGITERQEEMQVMFEIMFNLHFKKNFKLQEQTRVSNLDIDDETIEEIKRINHLDIQLYEFAKSLFNKRYKSLMQKT